MYLILRHAHSGWRYLLLTIAALAILIFIRGLVAKAKWMVWSERLSLFYLIAVDVQVLTGLLLYFGAGWWRLGDPLRAYEHPTTMLLALVLVHIGRKQVKRVEEDRQKFARALGWYGSAAILLALGVWRITLGQGG